MGLPQITMGMYSLGDSTSLEKFPVVGLHKSHSADNLVTDSAAGATAFSAGVKTYNGAIGVDVDTQAVKTILESCEEAGMNTGMVATSVITHATPGSFAAHVKSRQLYEDIALDFLDADVDVLIGGGKKHFDRREDERNLVNEFSELGYTTADFVKQPLSTWNTQGADKLLYLTADGNPLPRSQGRDYLPAAASLAIDHLSSKEEAFFLLIEGSQIDWGGHANNRDYIISEFEEYNEVIANVFEWAKADGETLVIVTADHETGGLAINPGSTRDSIVAAFTTPKHSATMIPVFAYGPGSENFAGIYQNTAIFHKMMALLEL